MIKRVLALLILIPLAMDFALNVFDIWGVRYFSQLSVIHGAMRGGIAYYLPKGHYNLRHWWYGFEAEQITDGQRRVPDSRGWCQVAFVGDSVTWGFGVDDDQTWIDLLAKRLPQMEAINLGEIGYNSEQVLDSIRSHPGAIAYVYLIIPNDVMATQTLPEVPAEPMLLSYARVVRAIFNGYPPIVLNDWQADARFRSDLATMRAIGNVYFVAADHPALRTLLEGQPIRAWVLDSSLSDKYRISLTDAHPNPTGHQIIASQLESVLKSVLTRYCGEF